MIKMKMSIRWTSLVVCLLLVRHVVSYAPPTESMKKEERFIHCILAIEEADTNQDDRLTRNEYQPFVKYLSTLMFDEAVIVDNELPRELGHLYNGLIKASGAPEHESSIDIFGARMDELSKVSQDRLTRLHSVCEMVMKELAMLGPRTDAPIQLMDLMETGEEFEEEEDGIATDAAPQSKGDLDYQHEMDELTHDLLSVHSSFVISNTRSLSPKQIDLTHTGVLYDAYVDFIDSLMEHICPMGNPCPEELEEEVEEMKEEIEGTPAPTQKKHNPHWYAKHGLDVDGNPLEPSKEEEEGEVALEEEEVEVEYTNTDNSTRALLLHERRLCEGDYRRMRRMLCGTLNRRLVKAAVFSDAELYEVKEQDCPIGFARHAQHHNGGIIPKCGTVYAHYDVIVSRPQSTDVQDIEHNYVAVTKSAIADGLLQFSLDKVAPDSYYTILGAGQHRYPIENAHHWHTIGEARVKKGHTERPHHPKVGVGIGHEHHDEHDNDDNGGGRHRNLRN